MQASHHHHVMLCRRINEQRRRRRSYLRQTTVILVDLLQDTSRVNINARSVLQDWLFVRQRVIVQAHNPNIGKRIIGSKLFFS